MALDKFIDEDLEYIEITNKEEVPINDEDLPEILNALEKDNGTARTSS